jgi:hypothetical protein
VGHGGLGAAAGCAYGMHRRKYYDRKKRWPLWLRSARWKRRAPRL